MIARIMVISVDPIAWVKNTSGSEFAVPRNIQYGIQSLQAELPAIALVTRGSHEEERAIRVRWLAFASSEVTKITL